jgi:ADP-ribosylation factor GTPase-activating protein 2/3
VISIPIDILIFTTDDDERYARNKFGSQKGISSDEFFGRNSFDPSSKSEARTRLQNFEGASAISSNQYFGRPEDDGAPPDDGYGDLEGAARDFVRKFGLTAGDDLDNLTAVLGEGASKLQSKLVVNSCTLVICLLTRPDRCYTQLFE